MKKWRCRVCGHLHNGDAPPERCPICGAPLEQFELVENNSITPGKGDGPVLPAVIEGQFAWELQPDKIPESLVKETVVTDVVVVGGGEAGLVSALSATESGAQVIVLEKHTTGRYGGQFNAAINSKMMWEKGIKPDKELIVLYFMKLHDSRPDQRLIRLWADHSEEVIDWMLSMTEAEGIETKLAMWPIPQNWIPEQELYPEYNYYSHAIGYKYGDSNKPLLDCLKKNLLKKGGKILYSTPGVQLIREAQGRVTGVIARNKEGYIKFIARKAVILCTGDFGNDPEMMSKYCSPSISKLAATTNLYTSFMSPEEIPQKKLNVGDGQKMAMWIGGQMEERNIGTMSWAFGPGPNSPSFLKINAKGERFISEDTCIWLLANAIVRQPQGIVWEVFDAKYPEEFHRTPMSQVTSNSKGLSIDEQKNIEALCVRADTIEELAIKIKVPAETLKATVDRRNELVRSGKDQDFGVPLERFVSIEKPPFFAAPLQPMFAVSVGGLIVNEKLQALDADSNVIPGLYLAGNTVGKRFGEHFNNPIGGMSNGFACTHGYLAGKNAAAEKSITF